VIASDVNTVSTNPITPNTYTVNATSLNGTYTVGALGNYTTLTAAVAAYNTACLNGPVLFNLIDANYAGETFPISINANAFASATNTLTIKTTQPNTTISGTSATALITLNGADWVTIDGSISNTPNTICPPSSASRNLTITNTSTSTTSAVIWLQTVTIGLNSATNNTIKNVNVIGSGNTQTLVGIGCGSSTIGIASLGSLNNNNSYINNNISKTQYGIYSQGATIGAKNTGTVINQNLVNTVAPNNVRRAGVFVGFENNISISGNSISEIASATSVEDVFGITLGTIAISTSTFTGNEVSNATITKNLIGSIRQTATYSACGIFVAPALSGTNQISNNMISGVSSNGTSGDFMAGMMIGGGNGSITQIYNNTITMTSVPANTGATDKSYALAIGGVNPVVDIRNNIFYNTQSNGTSTSYAVNYGYTPFTNLTSNNNNYYVASGASFFIGATGSISAPINQLTLTNLQLATGKDGAAQNVMPTFVSATDLHLDPLAAVNIPLFCNGVTIPSVIDDIDCAVRKPKPTIGADDVPVTVPASITIAETSGTTNNDGVICDGTSATLTASGGATYLWSTGATTAVINVNTSGTYVVTVTDAGGCQGSTSAAITVNPTPTVSIAVSENSGNSPNDGILCSGASATLTASGGGTYLWSTGATTSEIITGMAGSYIITVTSNGCSVSTSTSITVNPLPTAGIMVADMSGLTDNDGVICSGSSASLTASGGSIYLWSNAQTAALINVSSEGSYVVTVTDLNGCTSATSTYVDVLDSPIVNETITQPSTCFSMDGEINITVLSGTAPYTYTWITPNGCGVIQGQQDQSGLCVGSYTVEISDVNGCTVIETFVLSIPGGCGGCSTITSIDVNPNDICLGDSALFTALNALPGAIFEWFDAMTGGNLVGTSNPLQSGALSSTTTYCVEQTIFINQSVTYDYTGTEQTFVVPAGVTSINIEAFGAQGANGSSGSSPGNAGLGGSATGTLAVTPGDILYINVGGQDGFNGGGPAGVHLGVGIQTFSGNGGGAS
ncbi:MAG TPA: hypothetical protein PKD51_19845, partial [Saprospiraceae bacterium]|nr:hypothetical protein [Saprospiraceae bacterium]